MVSRRRRGGQADLSSSVAKALGVGDDDDELEIIVQDKTRFRKSVLTVDPKELAAMKKRKKKMLKAANAAKKGQSGPGAQAC